MSKVSVEILKAQSNGLRGTIPDELAAPTDHFSEEAIQLLKFHGTYQQDDRDARKTARETGAGRDYSFMVRTKNPGGYLPAVLWSAIDDIADRYGNGTIRITTRAGLQLHGVRKSNLQEVIKQINAHLGSTLGACGDINRNVTASPFPFASPPYRATREAAHRIAELLTPHATAYYEIWQDGEEVHSSKDEPIYGTAFMPRKFKIGVATPGDNSIDLFTNDLGVVPIVDASGEVVAYNLAVGGGLGMTHGKKNTYPRLADPLGSVPPARMLDAVKAIVLVQRDHGDRTDRRHARLKYLLDDRGLDWFREAVEAVAGFKLDTWQALPDWTVPTYAGWNEQGDGKWFFALDVLSGRVRDTETVRTKTALREIADRGHDLVATPIQNILIVDVSSDEKPLVDAILTRNGVVVRGGLDPFSLVALACPALPTCGLSLAESERVLPVLLEGLSSAWEAAGLAPDDGVPTLRMTGCPNGCARPYVGEIGIVGVSLDRYNVYLGGNPESTRLNAIYREKVPLGDIATTLQPVFEAFAHGRRPGESFGDYCKRALADPVAV